jgi:hypothetical protein
MIALASAGPSSAQTVSCEFTYGTTFVPSWGESHIGSDAHSRYVWQYFYWHDVARLYWLNSAWDTTFELDTFFYNYDGLGYGDEPAGFWDSNLPSAYVDTQFFDGEGEKAVTIGSAFAWDLRAATLYYYVTRMTSGGGLTSLVKVQAQRGRRWPSDCYSTWCSYGCSTEVNYTNVIPFQSGFYAPGCRRFWFWWYSSLDLGC